MGFMARLNAFLRVMRRKKRPMDAIPLLRQRPALLLGVNSFETALIACDRVPARLKALARIKTSALIGCPFLLDIGFAVGREMGVTERQLLELGQYQTSDAFDDLERAALISPWRWPGRRRHPQRTHPAPAQRPGRSTARRAGCHHCLGELPGSLQPRFRSALFGILGRRILRDARETRLSVA